MLPQQSNGIPYRPPSLPGSGPASMPPGTVTPDMFAAALQELQSNPALMNELLKTIPGGEHIPPEILKQALAQVQQDPQAMNAALQMMQQQAGALPGLSPGASPGAPPAPGNPAAAPPPPALSPQQQAALQQIAQLPPAARQQVLANPQLLQQIPGLSPLDPRILSQLANPNQDRFERSKNPLWDDNILMFMPPLPFTAAGVAAGIGTSVFTDRVFTNERLARAIAAVDHTGPMQALNEKIKQHIANLPQQASKNSPWYVKWFGAQDAWERLFFIKQTGDAVQTFRQEYIETVIRRRFKNQLAPAQLDDFIKAFKKQFLGVNLSIASGPKDLEKAVKAFNTPENLKKLGFQQTGWFARKGSQAFARKQIENYAKTLRGIDLRFDSIYQYQRDIVNTTVDVARREMGPVGRFLTGVVGNIRRVFTGETTASKAMAGSGGLFSAISGHKFIGASLNGIFVFGSALHAAHKAEKGEKTKNFFHELLGTGLGTFIGIELSQFFVEATGLFQRMPLLKGLANRTVLPGILAKIPLIGGLTWPGFLTLFVLAPILSGPIIKLGEGIANLIFGKPKQKSEPDQLRKEQTTFPQFQQPQVSQLTPSPARVDYVMRVQNDLAGAPSPEEIAYNPSAERQNAFAKTIQGSEQDWAKVLGPAR